MLSTALTGGLVAGREAASGALKRGPVPDLDGEQVSSGKEEVFAPSRLEEGYTPKEFEKKIRQVMEYYMGHRRSVKGLNMALESLERLREHAGEIRATDIHSLMQTHEAKHLLKYSQLMVRSVIMRKGMKGFYTVVDYPPKMDRDLRTRYVIQWQEQGVPKAEYEMIEGENHAAEI
jgi:succinate dehydrogenase/fumarate reductase flavoprotein subunit